MKILGDKTGKRMSYTEIVGGCKEREKAKEIEERREEIRESAKMKEEISV